MKKYLFIALGGMLGAVSRFFMLSINIAVRLEGFPINTLITNIVGSSILSMIMGAISKGLRLKEEIRIGLCVGFLGSFTTFSTLCKESVFLLKQQKIMLFFIYVFLSVMLGLGTAFLGIKIGETWIRKRVMLKEEGEAD